MKYFFTRTLLLFIVLAFSSSFTAHARQSEEARAAWQVTRFDVTVDASPSSGGERLLPVRAVLSARNVGAGAGRTFTVRLSPDAKVNSASVADAQARFTSRNDERNKLQMVQVTLPAPVAPGGVIQFAFDYQLPVRENSGLASFSPEGLQLLPLSNWYPMPNTPLAPRGADYAPLRIVVNGLAPGETIISTGKASGNASEQTLNAQPFFLTGKWETVEGANEARGVSALLAAGAGADERRQAEALISLAAAARAFYAGLLGPAPDSPVRLVGVRRGAGFDMAGTLLVDHAVFRRAKPDSITALHIAESIARLWVGGVKGVQDEGSGVVREGLARFLATLFLEKQFGREVADAERMRLALLYASVARRDAPLSQLTPAFDTYFNSVPNKGALVWRLLMNAAGREQFMGVLRREFDASREGTVSLARLRSALAGVGGEKLTNLMTVLFDQPTDTDLLVGLPQPRAGGAWVSALRNMGSTDVEVSVQATTERGERLNTVVRVPAKAFGEALFQTTAKIIRVEVDPEKLYPQLDYTNDVVPKSPDAETSIADARTQLGAQQPARAEGLAREVLARVPGKEEARIVLGRALLEQNKPDEAEKEFRAALGLPLPTPATLAWANIGLGEIALRRNRAAEAVKLFDEAVRADAEYASTLNARAARLKAEAANGAAPAPDEQVKAAVAAFDAAIRGGKKTDIDAFIVPGELVNFSKGIVGTQPEVWQTRVLRTENLSGNRVAADVSLTARTLGRDQSGTAVLVFLRTPGGLKLSEIQFFEVR
ncbi:MAG: tetratricopeptide repeat protein [Acidobacteria bacterium]|nr:tetratricopeptide repeat protein [Acidobacteriota bacterium]